MTHEEAHPHYTDISLPERVHWAPGVTRGNVDKYMDSCDVENGVDIQGGVHKQLQDIHPVSTWKRMH